MTVEPERTPPIGASPLSYLGAGAGLYASAAEIDAELREQRDGWD